MTQEFDYVSYFMAQEEAEAEEKLKTFKKEDKLIPESNEEELTEQELKTHKNRVITHSHY